MNRLNWLRVTIAAALFGLGISERTLAAALDPVEYYPLRIEAIRLWSADEHASAAAAFERLTETYAGDGQVWFGLGGCRAALGRWGDAVVAYRAAYDLGFWSRAEVAHEIASCHARAGHADSALTWIERSLALGYEERPELLEQSDFELLRSNPRFRRDVGVLAEPIADRVTGWQTDLDHLVAEIKRLHFVYRTAPLPADFDSGLRDLRGRIASLSDAAMMAEIQRLIVLLGDGHSTLYPMPTERVQLRQIPLQFYSFADGLYVLDAPEEWRDWIGARIERVGSLDAAAALLRVGPYVPRDNANGLRVMGPYFMRFATLLHAIGVISTDAAIPFTGVRPDGRKLQANIPVAAHAVHGHAHLTKLRAAGHAGAPKAPLYLQRVNEHYWFEPMTPDSVCYVQFNQVVDMQDETLRQFALRLRKHLDTNPVRTLVVDVRHNNGGNGELLTAMIRTLVHFETTHPGARLFVLTSPFTFSAAQSFIAQIDRLTNTIFVGEPSGSRPNFVGEDTSLLLPWSGLRGSLSSRAHRVSSKDERVWIAPEMPVASTGADWLTGRDDALDAILRLVHKR